MSNGTLDTANETLDASNTSLDASNGTLAPCNTLLNEPGVVVGAYRSMSAGNAAVLNGRNVEGNTDSDPKAGGRVFRLSWDNTAVPAPGILMSPGLQLHATDFQSETRWRWELRDENGVYLADHEVKLDRSTPEVRGFLDLPGYLENRPPDAPPEESLQRVGDWMARQVFGPILPKIGERLDFPATVVRVHVPKEAQALLHRPFELAHLDGRSLAEAGVRFVYQLAGAAEPKGLNPPPTGCGCSPSSACPTAGAP